METRLDSSEKNKKKLGQVSLIFSLVFSLVFSICVGAFALETTPNSQITKNDPRVNPLAGVPSSASARVESFSPRNGDVMKWMAKDIYHGEREYERVSLESDGILMDGRESLIESSSSKK